MIEIRRSLLILAGPLLFGAGYVWHRHVSTLAPHVAAEQTQTKALQPATVSFPQGSPQLQFIATQQVVLLPEPLIEPLNGRVAYDENFTARVSAPIAGRVVKIDVQPGDSVRAGAPLAWIDAPDYAAAVADERKAENDLRLKDRGYERAKELFDYGVTARKDYEAAETDYRQAQAELQRARLRLRNLNAGSSVRQDGRVALRSPISGIIADRQVNPGAEVRPDLPNPLFVVTDPAHVWVMIDLPERYLSKVYVGQVVSIEVDAYKGIDISGRVASVGQVLDPATRRVQVRCVVDNPRKLLKPEMFARVVPLSQERERRARIPNSALMTDGLYSFVFVEKAPGVFEKRQVSLGLQGRDESYVAKGLADGEKVVINGTLLLQSELSTRQ